MKIKKLAHPNITKMICFEEDAVNSLVIENRDFFRQCIKDLYNRCEGHDGNFVLSEDSKVIECSKHMELITTFVPFEINKKTLLTRLCTYAEKASMSESNYESTQTLVSEIERYLDSLFDNLSYSFEYDKLNMSSIIKAAGVVIADDYESELEKIIDYMQLVTELEKERIFVFVNMRSYFSDSDMDRFVKDVLSRKFRILLIDNSDNKMLTGEKRITIDADLCEF